MRAFRQWARGVRSPLRRYGVAVLACITAAVLTAMMLIRFDHAHAIAALLAVILLSGWYGGAGPAILALVLSVLTDCCRR
jgi:K+-sensing histidine kinase KdpD